LNAWQSLLAAEHDIGGLLRDQEHRQHSEGHRHGPGKIWRVTSIPDEGVDGGAHRIADRGNNAIKGSHSSAGALACEEVEPGFRDEREVAKHRACHDLEDYPRPVVGHQREQPDRRRISQHADEQRRLRADAADNPGVDGGGQEERQRPDAC
jgi:hypothetical protein